MSSDGATGRGGDARRHRVSLKILEPAGGFESWLVNSWSMAGGGLYAFLRSIYASCYANHRGTKPIFYLLDPELCPGGSDFQPYVPGFPFLPMMGGTNNPHLVMASGPRWRGNRHAPMLRGTLSLPDSWTYTSGHRVGMFSPIPPRLPTTPLPSPLGTSCDRSLMK